MITNADPQLPTPPIEAAWAALATYNHGSGRAALSPLDEAVNAAARDAAARASLEAKLVEILRSQASVVAKEFACGKLALIGGPGAVAALANLLASADLAHAATNALQLMTCPEAGAALRASAPKLTGLPRVGVLTALGSRRDLAAVEVLASALADADPRVTSAAAAALGEIASAGAARALGEALPKTPPALQPALADACLVCAERLKAAGNTASSRALTEALLSAQPPKHVQTAARRLQTH